METKLYNIEGKEAGKMTLPENLFGLPWNADLVHQVVVAMQANARPNVANTKDRGQVRGGGKKPWQQKGTGRARHGSSRSPIWKGGGVTHGPKAAKIYAQKINRSMAAKALLTVLSRKYKDGEVIFVDSLEMQAPKASAGKAVLSALGKHFHGLSKKKNAALIALPVRHTPTIKSFQNFGNIAVEEVRNLNPLSIMSAKYLVIASPKDAIEILGKKTTSTKLGTSK
ncbi:50S ribosomal protein L4 [Candidatus Kaiserbacteria bacterium]|nr:50S ribosomal protein L4 [Candidatus Kaiserbacteria bacterium]